jgi:hypothetical protein
MELACTVTINGQGSQIPRHRGWLGNWFSLEKEIRMGKQYAQMVESSAKLVQDPVVYEYVNRIGQNIVRISDAKVPFKIKVIDASEVNAFTLRASGRFACQRMRVLPSAFIELTSEASLRVKAVTCFTVDRASWTRFAGHKIVSGCCVQPGRPISTPAPVLGC